MALRPGRVGLASHLVNTDGTLKGSAVTIPDASTTKKGVVKIGTGLSVSSGKVGVTDPIPEHTVAQAGKVLKVTDDGTLEWSDPPSGGVTLSSMTVIENAVVRSGTISSNPVRNIWYVEIPEDTALVYGTVIMDGYPSDDLLVATSSVEPSIGVTGATMICSSTAKSYVIDFSVTNQKYLMFSLIAAGTDNRAVITFA